MIERLAGAYRSGCVDVVKTLPEWFSYPGALEEVDAAARSQEGFVAMEDGAVAGFVTLKARFDESMEITFLAVRKDCRAGGYGRALVRAACDHALSQGASTICLLTFAGPGPYEETVGFYRRVGFWRVKEMALTEWGGATALLMAAPIDQID